MLRSLQIERDIGKWCLKSNTRRDIDIEDKLLQRLLDFNFAQLVVVDEWREQRIEVRKRLRTSRFSLKRVEKVDNLSEH